MEDKHIIENTIRSNIYTDYSRMRFYDFLLKHQCFPCGAGVKDGKAYLLFDCDEYLYYKDIFYSRQQEEYEKLKEY